MSVCAVIPARAGSKGIPGKNLRRLNGKPLIAHTIEAALNAACVERVLVSTDSAEIAKVALGYGAEVPALRPAELAGDSSAVIDAVEHLLSVLRGYHPEYIALLQPTSPLRRSQDIDAAFRHLQRCAAPSILGVSEAASHPFLCRKIEEGILKPFIESPLNDARRQDLPSAYVLNGAIYIAQTAVLTEFRSWNVAGALAYVMSAARSVDIDSELDLAWAEWLLSRETLNCG